MRSHSVLAILLTVVLVGVMAFGIQNSPAMQAGRGLNASVAPQFVAGNPTCTSLGYAIGYKVDPPNPGVYPISPGHTVTVSSDGTFFNWSSTLSLDAVIAKGGPNANLFVYDPPSESFGDTGLFSPTAPNGNPFGLSHIEFCFDLEPTPTVTSTPTHTAVPTNTNTPTHTAVPSNTPTHTAVPTGTDTPTHTAVPSNTPTNTAVPTSTDTPTSTAQPTSTDTPTSTAMPTGTDTPTSTAEPTATNTPTPPDDPGPGDPTATNTATAEPSATNTATADPTATNTAPANPTATNTAPANPTATNTPPADPDPGDPTATNTAPADPTATDDDPGPGDPTATNQPGPVDPTATTAPPSDPGPQPTVVQPTDPPTVPTGTPAPACAALNLPTLIMGAAPAQALPGTEAAYTLRVTNPHAFDVPDVNATLSLSGLAQYLSASASQGQPVFQAGSNAVTLAIGTLGAGQSVELNVRVLLAAGAPASAPVTANGSVSVGGFTCLQGSATVTITPAGIPVTGVGPGLSELRVLLLAGLGLAGGTLLAGRALRRKLARR